MFCPFYAVQTLMFFLWVPNFILFSLWAKFICSILFLWTRFMFCPLHVDQRIFRFFSRDVTVWLFRLYWILFPEMFQLAISSLLEGSECIFCSPCAPQSPLRLFSRDVTVWLFRLYWILFPEMSQLAISSLLEDSECICFFSTSPHTWFLEVLLN